MRADGPSLTALGVAARRLALARPAWPTGDAEAEDRLAHHLLDSMPAQALSLRRASSASFAHWVEARTEFFDAVLLAALAVPVPQTIIVGAGYDGRALRFRTPGVTFFELDHPLTQKDKRERLTAVGARADDVVFVAADFVADDVDEALATAGHDAARPSLFLCEGVLRYLTEEVIGRLLQRLADRAAPGSALAVSIATREPGTEPPEVREAREAREATLAAGGEAVLTVPPRAIALAWLAAAGWSVAPDGVAHTGEGRVLVRAMRPS
jgi:methyltransferase (TIGR00027 family)